MFRRGLIFGVFVATMTVMFGGHTLASRVLRIGGTEIEIGSLVSTVVVSKTKSDTAQLIGNEQEYVMLDFVVFCANPGGNEDGTGRAFFGDPRNFSTNGLFFDENEGDFGRKQRKGLREATTFVEPSDFLDPANVCANGNWEILNTLALRFRYRNVIYLCAGPEAAPCAVQEIVDIEEGECSIPLDFDISDLDTWPSAGTLYEDCSITLHQHSEI